MTAKKIKETQPKDNSEPVESNFRTLKKGDGNSNGHTNLEASMELLLQNQQEISDRLSDIEEKGHNDGEGAALVKLANMYFNTDDKHIPELSFISPLAARPFAEAMALDAMTTEEVRSGKTSLNKLLILTYLRFQRSVHGRHLGIGAEALREQISADSNKEDENMDAFQAGRE